MLGTSNLHGARQNSYEQATRTAQDKTVTGVVPCIAVFFASWGWLFSESGFPRVVMDAEIETVRLVYLKFWVLVVVPLGDAPPPQRDFRKAAPL